MKKLFLTFSICAVSFAAFGQDTISLEKFVSKIQEYNQLDSIIYAQKDWKKGEKLFLEFINDFNKLSKDSQKQANDVCSNLYYGLTCFQSLQNRKKEAVKAFELAVKYGYDDYRHAKTDSDLDNIRKEKRFVAALNKIKGFDKLVILQNSGKYQTENTDTLPKFTYQSVENGNLKDVKEYFNLDSIAGNGGEIKKILNLMYWVHNNIRHDGGNYSLAEFDAIDLYNYHKATGKGINCRHLAITLNEMYLSMGIKSRYVTCLPQSSTDQDCHVINAVYSNDLKKWLYIDPTFAAYICDENGNLLSIQEVRERLIENKPLVLNEDANWNNENKQTKEHYLENYMAKNLYWLQIPVESKFNVESRYRQQTMPYVSLVPLGFEPFGNTSNNIVAHDDNYFWQMP
jgi:hypothetical protein